MVKFNRVFLLISFVLLGNAFAVNFVKAATTYNFNELYLCTVNKGLCSPQKTRTINVSREGDYSLRVTVERGNDLSRYECQDQESFYMVINGQRTSTVNDPDRCEWQGTVKTQSVSGRYHFNRGDNTIVFHHAYNLAQAESVESLTVKSLEITRIPNPIDGQCGTANGETYSSRPSNNLCLVGTPSDVFGFGPWTWQCSGYDGGRTVSCSADITNPSCGTANGRTFSSKPSNNLCSVGSHTSVRENDNTWNWQCAKGTKKVSCQANKYVPVCGNNVIDSGEQCDDGNNQNGDGCSSACKIERTSIKIDKNDNDNGDDHQNVERNGVAEFKIKVTNVGERSLENVVVRDERTPSCSKTANETRSLYSGDYLSPGESFSYTCSNNNVISGYTNVARVIADGINGGNSVTDSDTSSVSVFVPNFCGDGTINQPSEQCDNGSNNGNICSPEYGESCQYCSSTCELITLNGGNCGNGIVEDGEQCDDGNSQNGDGCSSVCITESSEPTPEPTPEPAPKKSKKCKGSIGNYIWLDINGDGKQDVNEKGIKNIKLKLKWAGKDGKWGNSDDKTWRTHTNKKGRYIFDDLCKGKYKLYVNNLDTKKYSKTFDPDGKKDNKTKIKLKTNSDNHTKADFGYNKKKSTPATGAGAVALYLTGLLSFVGYLSFKQYQSKKIVSLEK